MLPLSMLYEIPSLNLSLPKLRPYSACANVLNAVEMFPENFKMSLNTFVQYAIHGLILYDRNAGWDSLLDELIYIILILY